MAVSGRPGNIGQVSRRLRPMAEQLLAENGDNVLDVLLQLLEVPTPSSHISTVCHLVACRADRLQCRVHFFMSNPVLPSDSWQHLAREDPGRAAVAPRRALLIAVC